MKYRVKNGRFTTKVAYMYNTHFKIYYIIIDLFSQDNELQISYSLPPRFLTRNLEGVCGDTLQKWVIVRTVGLSEMAKYEGIFREYSTVVAYMWR